MFIYNKCMDMFIVWRILFYNTVLVICFRTKSLTWFRELLNGIKISPEWIQNGRPCSPRVLFVFETCQLFSYHENSSNVDGFMRHKHKVSFIFL